jgi:putative nucleotidyltransferase with HDIG domain
MKQEIGKLLYSMRVRLVLLVVVSLIPVVALFLYKGHADRTRAAVHAETDAMRLVDLVCERERQLIEGAQQMLMTLAHTTGIRDDDCRRILAEVLDQYRAYLNIGVIDLDGNVTCSALPWARDVNLSDRSYFRRAVRTGEFSVGDYQVGRITNMPSINFGQPVFAEDGQLEAVVFAAMDLSWLRRFALVSKVPNGTVLTLVDGNGTILARTVGASQWVGKRIPDGPYLDTLIGGGPGTLELTDIDGVHRLCAFAPLHHGSSGNVYVSVGIPMSQVFTAIDTHHIRDMLTLAFVTLLSVMGAWFGGNAFIARRVGQLVNVTSRLGGGDLAARARETMHYGRDEIGELARGLDGMAEAINHRTDQLRHTQNELLSAVEATIEGWARALERRDSDTQGHTRRVAELSVRLARAMGVAEPDIVHIRRGALLHDIGKMGIPDSILLKPGPLTDEEWEVMRRHPTYAYEWLSHIQLLKPALEIPYGHHERWDGSGYPRGLVGTQISMAARIFAVVDVYDGVTSDRPYRDAWSEEHAMRYIVEGSGILFDPAVVAAFVQLKTEAPPSAEVVYRHATGSPPPEREDARVEEPSLAD